MLVELQGHDHNTNLVIDDMGVAYVTTGAGSNTRSDLRSVLNGHTLEFGYHLQSFVVGEVIPGLEDECFVLRKPQLRLHFLDINGNRMFTHTTRSSIGLARSSAASCG